MYVRDPLWVYLDFGTDHRVRRVGESPGSEWHGPFPTWGQAKRFICSSGAAYASGITCRTAWWRSARLAEVLEGDKVDE